MSRRKQFTSVNEANNYIENSIMKRIDAFEKALNPKNALMQSLFKQIEQTWSDLIDDHCENQLITLQNLIDLFVKTKLNFELNPVDNFRYRCKYLNDEDSDNCGYTALFTNNDVQSHMQLFKTGFESRNPQIPFEYNAQPIVCVYASHGFAECIKKVIADDNARFPTKKLFYVIRSCKCHMYDIKSLKLFKRLYKVVLFNKQKDKKKEIEYLIIGYN